MFDLKMDPHWSTNWDCRSFVSLDHSSKHETFPTRMRKSKSTATDDVAPSEKECIGPQGAPNLQVHPLREKRTSPSTSL